MAPQPPGGPSQPTGYGAQPRYGTQSGSASQTGHGSQPQYRTQSGYGTPAASRPASAGPTQTRPPVRPRVSSRRPLRPLILLVVLAVVALGVWFKVLQSDQARPSSDADACPAPPTVTAQDPASVRLRIFNASETSGLAAQVSAEFVGRGFVVTETDNDRSGREVSAVGELRYGPRGAEKAAFVALFLPGVSLIRDTRSDDLLDVALGPDYAGLATPEAVAIAIATPVAPTNLACASGDPSRTVDDPAATS